MPAQPGLIYKSEEGANPFTDSTLPTCLEKSAKAKKTCFDLKPSEELGSVGSVCLEVHGSPAELEITYETTSNWTLTQADFWFGDDILDMPAKKSGYPYLDKFPYFWCNSSGSVSWGTKFPFDVSSHCRGMDTYELPAVAHARLEEQSENGTAIKRTKHHAFAFEKISDDSSKWFSWFNLPVDCGCERYGDNASIEDPKSLAPSACPDQSMEAEHQCQELRTGNQTSAGSVCVEISGSSILDVTYEAANGFSFTKTDFWFDSNPSALKLLDDGLPDVEPFNFFWRNSSGQKTWSTRVPMKSYYSCAGPNEVMMQMVAHARVAPISSDGTLDLAAEESAFAFGSNDEGTLKASDASFSFPMQCECGEEKVAEEPANQSPDYSSASLLDKCPNRIAEADKACYDLVASDTTSAGSVCVEVSGNPSAVKVTRTVADDWVLLKTKFWYGDVSTDLPRKRNGLPNVEKFPYFWGNSSGETEWTGSAFIDSSTCKGVEDYTVDLVVHSTIIRKHENGTFIRGTKESSFAYELSSSPKKADGPGSLALNIDCKCSAEKAKASPLLSASASLPPAKSSSHSTKSQSYCIDGDNGSGRECHKMTVGGSIAAGMLCAEAVENSEYFQFSFQSMEGWTLLATEFWLGDNIHDLPMMESGDIDTKRMPYYWRNSTGEPMWQTKIGLNVSFDCSMIEQYKLAVVASSTFGKLDDQGELIDDTEVVAFVEDRPDNGWFGWFALELRCNCDGPVNSLLSDAMSFFTGGETPGCVPSSIFVDEDFEVDGAASSWDNGVISKGDDLTSFLGLGGSYVPEVSRTFSIPASPDGTRPDSISLEFVLYTIDSWNEEDSVRVTVGLDEIDLGRFDSGGSSSAEGLTTHGGISWNRGVISQGQNLGFGEADDQKHLVQLTVPGSNIAEDGTLYFGVKVALDANAENSAGIDDLMLEAHYNCPEEHHRDLVAASEKARTDDVSQPNNSSDVPSESKNRTPTSNEAVGGNQESPDDDSTGPYCLAEDFPCGDGHLVNVCHYSRLRGHQTLCIPEKESHILRYYPQDYCGPCIGTVSGLALNWNWS